MTDFLLRIFVRGHDRPDDPETHLAIGRFGGAFGIFCNAVLFAAKLTAGLLSGSVSIIADAVNNLTDATSSVVTLLGFRMAQRPADADHPYGHARYDYLSGLVVAALILVLGGAGAFLCYLTTVVSQTPLIGLIACALTGLCTSMMWPGSLVVAADQFPAGGVFIYALMAAGGDLGASVGPQLVGVVTDAVIAHPAAAQLASQLALSPEQLGMKAGLLVASLFPMISIAVFGVILHLKKKEEAKA